MQIIIKIKITILKINKTKNQIKIKEIKTKKIIQTAKKIKTAKQALIRQINKREKEALKTVRYSHLHQMLVNVKEIKHHKMMAILKVFQVTYHHQMMKKDDNKENIELIIILL